MSHQKTMTNKQIKWPNPFQLGQKLFSSRWAIGCGRSASAILEGRFKHGMKLVRFTSQKEFREKKR